MRRHRHRMDMAAVSYLAAPFAQLGQAHQTVILFKCEHPVSPDCIASKMVIGHWTEHDLDFMPKSWPAEITQDDLPAVSDERGPLLEEDQPFRSGGELPGG